MQLKILVFLLDILYPPPVEPREIQEIVSSIACSKSFQFIKYLSFSQTSFEYPGHLRRVFMKLIPGISIVMKKGSTSLRGLMTVLPPLLGFPLNVKQNKNANIRMTKWQMVIYVKSLISQIILSDKDKLRQILT